MQTTLDTRNFTRSSVPSFPFEKAVATILPGWEISLALVGETRAKHLNETLRGKGYIPNVLSYETGKKSGEIVICLQEAKRQAPSYDMPYPVFVGFLFIHGCLHLKGRRHGTTMEHQERELLSRLIPYTRSSLHVPTNRNRHRHRNAPDESRGSGRGHNS